MHDPRHNSDGYGRENRSALLSGTSAGDPKSANKEVLFVSRNALK